MPGAGGLPGRCSARTPGHAPAMNNLAFLYQTQEFYGEGGAAVDQGSGSFAAHARRAEPVNVHLDEQLGQRVSVPRTICKGRVAVCPIAGGSPTCARTGAPGTHRSMNNLASLYRVQRHFAKAVAVSTQILEVSWRVVGPEHPDTLTAINNLAGAYETQGCDRRSRCLARCWRSAAACSERSTRTRSSR